MNYPLLPAPNHIHCSTEVVPSVSQSMFLLKLEGAKASVPLTLPKR